MLNRDAQIQLAELVRAAAAIFIACLFPAMATAHESSSYPINAPTNRLEVPYRLTHQNENPIFRYAISGGVRGANKPIDKLLIYDNGNIVVTGDVGVPDRKAKLSPTELETFKDFLLKKNDFFSLNSADIEKRMNQNGATAITDGYSSIFSGNFDGKIHEVEIYSLWAATKSFPNFDEVRKCEAIEKRCKSIISAANLGDRGPKVLEAVNKEIKEKQLDIKPFKLSEMRLASQLPAGRFQVSFSRVHPGNTDDPPKTMHAIYFVKQADAKPQITFYGLPIK